MATRKGSIRLIVAAAAVLIGLVLYLVTSCTGYLAGSTLNVQPVICSVIAIVLLIAVFVLEGKLPKLLTDVLFVAAAVLVILSFMTFTLARVSLAADIYFIPVNYPAMEETALNISLAGIAVYIVSILVMIVEGFAGKE